MMRHLPERGEVASAPVTVALAAGCGDGISSKPASSPASAEVIARHMGLAKALGFAACTAATDPNTLLGRYGGYTSKVDWGTQRTVEVSPAGPTPSRGKSTSSCSGAPFGSGSLDLPGQCAAAAGPLGYASAGSARRGRVPGGLEGEEVSAS
jgi:hypothetical protein